MSVLKTITEETFKNFTEELLYRNDYNETCIKTPCIPISKIEEHLKHKQNELNTKLDATIKTKYLDKEQITTYLQNLKTIYDNSFNYAMEQKDIQTALESKERYIVVDTILDIINANFFQPTI